MADKNTSIDDKLAAELRSLRSSISTPQVLSGIIVFLVFLCFMPFMLFLLPVAILIMVLLFCLGTKTQGEAEQLAAKRLGSSISRLKIVENIGIADTLVLNDWGLVLTSPGKKSRELSWCDMARVEEPRIGILVFRAIDGNEFEVDLNEHNYLLITDAIANKIPGRTDFDVCFENGKSNLHEKLLRHPLKWKYKNQELSVSAMGVELNGKSMTWNEILFVQEIETIGEDTRSYSWVFKSSGFEFEVDDELVQAPNELSGFGGAEKLNAILEEHISDRVRFRPCRTPAGALNRARAEFDRNQEACKAAFAYALKNGGNFEIAIEPKFKHMLKIVEKFSLGGDNVQAFFMHYSELLKRTNRDKEAAEMLLRAE